MEILNSNEILVLLRNGLAVTIILMAVFYFVRFPENWNKVLKESLTKLIILIVPLVYTRLVIEEKFNNQIVAYYMVTVAFSVLFYELAGKHIVRKWFIKYRGENIKKGSQ